MFKKVVCQMVGFGALLGCLPLEAAKDGWYVQAGVDYAHAAGSSATRTPNSTSSSPWSGNLGGVDFVGGYKQFFGKKRHWGVRYYGLINLQGGGFSQKMGNKYPTQGPVGNFFYGVGIDALWTFYHNKGSEFGVFVGMAVGGSSWALGAGKANDVCQTRVNGVNCVSTSNFYFQQAIGNPSVVYSPTFVQWMFNFGMRANLGAHNGIEVGFRVPAINDPYYTQTKGDTSTFTYSFRRVIDLYANYVYNF
ncbi:outer membrane protein [Helicobacter sp. NHP22-001]|uniref:outer membrane protein n=1 Tax=Helicobacter sp. NHP22-001 TaxID=3040202 RepID=UPI00244D8561|nr:outer membrane protein [Helicobacter sp. NHP22-001]GMB95738.1 outer memeberane protein [Helicobacter sp. NHP22-001]